MDWGGAHLAAAQYVASASAEAPERSLLSAYHDISSPARMLMPRKVGVEPVGVVAVEFLQAQRDNASAADPPSSSLPDCTHLSAQRAQQVTVQAGPPLWSMPDNNHDLNHFGSTLVRASALSCIVAVATQMHGVCSRDVVWASQCKCASRSLTLSVRRAACHLEAKQPAHGSDLAAVPLLTLSDPQRLCCNALHPIPASHHTLPGALPGPHGRAGPRGCMPGQPVCDAAEHVYGR
jgi:hypothetical protein